MAVSVATAKWSCASPAKPTPESPDLRRIPKMCQQMWNFSVFTQIQDGPGFLVFFSFLSHSKQNGLAVLPTDRLTVPLNKQLALELLFHSRV